MTPEQCREGRRLLDWLRERLGGASVVPTYFITTYEQTGRAARSHAEGANPEPLESLRRAFEAAGIEFTNGEKCGMELRRSVT